MIQTHTYTVNTHTHTNIHNIQLKRDSIEVWKKGKTLATPLKIPGLLWTFNFWESDINNEAGVGLLALVAVAEPIRHIRLLKLSYKAPKIVLEGSFN